MNRLLRPRIWPSFSPSCRLYGPEAGRPRVLVPATYRSSTPRNQPPAVARWDNHLRGLATTIHETSGLGGNTGGNERAVDRDESLEVRIDDPLCFSDLLSCPEFGGEAEEDGVIG
jgi:hypothetical protein